MVIDYYNQLATELAEQYQSLAVDDVHRGWIDLIATDVSKPFYMLDIGAGSGRDARYFAQITPKANVVAIEPASEFAKQGKQYTQGQAVTWLADSLPALTQLKQAIAADKLATQYDLVLLSAVWMHLAPELRAQAMQNIAPLVATNGLLVISLRFGQSEFDLTTRQMFHVSVAEVVALAEQQQLRLVRHVQAENDFQQRDHISWQTLVFQAGAN